MCNRTMEQGTENMIYPSAVNDFLDGSFGCHENSDRLSPASSPASTIDGDSSGSQYGVDLSGKSESCSSLAGKSFTIAAILGLTAKRDDHLLNMSVQERLNRQGRMSGHYFYAQDDRLCFNGFEDQGAQDQMRSGNVTSKHSRLLPNTCANKSSRSKRIRTIFTPEQLERLEAEFERQQYMVGPERLYLAHALQLTEAQVKVWFQNRRIKWRKHHLELTHQRLAALQRHRQNQEDDLEHHT